MKKINRGVEEMLMLFCQVNDYFQIALPVFVPFRPPPKTKPRSMLAQGQRGIGTTVVHNPKNSKF
jgi:hypothetical protein